MLHLSRKVRSIRSSITIVKGFVLVAMISALVVVASSYGVGTVPFGTVRASEAMNMMQGDPAPTPPQRAGCDASRPK